MNCHNLGIQIILVCYPMHSLVFKVFLFPVESPLFGDFALSWLKITKFIH